ncbi:FadR family transcriptional regulator [Pelagibacterium sp. 26DY04]|uniref:FadR/GntR family transcriptional regulator n=1 Tax=Pelagibacterium sp. 26DY04 TaxID=2967130 RepID=UPI00281576D2|nr:FadR/GntR family transcriptional regulator [Pelagibacterium sp. 26DY04]WMT85931.1 FadR family transcriptional regulator [Pelagibacterium sp. 26DY04]
MRNRRDSLSQRIVEAVQDRIRDGSYGPGQKLPTEHELIGEFGVSRTVIREAIANLRANGLVTPRQGVGVFVTDQPFAQPFVLAAGNGDAVHEAVAVLELRIALEVETAGLAAARRTPEILVTMREALKRMDEAIAAGDDAIEADLAFHRAIAAATENYHFVNLFNYLGEFLMPRSRLNTSLIAHESRKDYLRHINDEHQRVFDAIAAGDSEAARGAMRLHLMGSKERLRASASE